MMNKLTRRLSKIPEEVRGEIEPYFVNSAPVLNEDSRKLTKLDDKTADYVRSGLTVSILFAVCLNKHVKLLRFLWFGNGTFCSRDGVTWMLTSMLTM